MVSASSANACFIRRIRRGCELPYLQLLLLLSFPVQLFQFLLRTTKFSRDRKSPHPTLARKRGVPPSSAAASTCYGFANIAQICTPYPFCWKTQSIVKNVPVLKASHYLYAISGKTLCNHLFSVILIVWATWVHLTQNPRVVQTLRRDYSTILPIITQHSM